MSFIVTETTNSKRIVEGWTLIAGFVAVVALSLSAGGAGAANFWRLAFPLGAALIGVILYFRAASAQYLWFAWWMWFLTPFIRRVIDYRSQWVDPSPVLLAPFLVALVTACAVFRRDSRLSRSECLPFVLTTAGIAYALGVGLIQNSAASVVPMLLNWLIPVLFGFYFLQQWREYPQLRQATQSCFVWMVLLTGAYGIYQYVVAPGWDAFWLSNVSSSSFGKPEPLEIRVFSTFNSPGPFGLAMMAGLLLLFSSRSWVRLPAAVAGFLSLLLALARSSWIGWIIGFVALFKSLDAKMRVRIFATAIVITLCLIPLALMEPFNETIAARFQSLSDPQEDASYKARVAGYYEAGQHLASLPIGTGFGGRIEFTTTEDETAIDRRDSGIIDILLTFGWLGGALYFAGVAILFVTLLHRPASYDDRFAIAARAVGFAIFAQFTLGSVMIAVSGVIFWSFCSLWLAAQRYHAFQAGNYLEDLDGELIL